VLEINSVGGVVDAGSEIYSLIEQAVSSGKTVVAEVQSLAASAASYLILACSEVRMSMAAQMMIHCASVFAWGNKNKSALRHDADCLAVTDETILNLYCKRCGDKASREELQAMMEAETYITAADCVRLGLADGIINEAPEAEGEAVALVASATNCVVRAMRTLPDIRDLMTREQERNNWQSAARAELERERLRYQEQ
jgi:ATP-dependent Clp protease protease subunit